MWWIKKSKHRDSSNKNTSPMDSSAKVLFNITVEKSWASTKAMDDIIKKNSKESGNDYNQKVYQVFFELLCFYMHIISRQLFSEFSPAIRQKSNDILGPMSIQYISTTFLKEASEQIVKELYEKMQNAEIDFSHCKKWLVHPNEDLAWADKIAGAKSKGIVNLLDDKIVLILDEWNPITQMKISFIIANGYKYKCEKYKKTISKFGRGLSS